MNRCHAVRCSLDLDSGRLDRTTEMEVLAHLRTCPACRDWLSIKRLLSDGLASRGFLDKEHPESSLLALCVVRPEELHEPGREQLRRHLESCSACSSELELARAAVKAARPSMRHDSELRAQPTPPDRWRRALAAALAFLFLGVSFYVASVLIDRPVFMDSPPQSVEGEGSEIRRPALPEPITELSGKDLDGTQVISGQRGLIVSSLTVNSGADVTFRAREVVAFADGFRVENGARINVGSYLQSPEDESVKTSIKTNQGRQ